MPASVVMMVPGALYPSANAPLAMDGDSTAPMRTVASARLTWVTKSVTSPCPFVDSSPGVLRRHRSWASPAKNTSFGKMKSGSSSGW